MSRLSLDYANCLSSRVGKHGLPENFLASKAKAAAKWIDSLARTRGTGWERWRELPFDPMRKEHLRTVKPLVKKFRGKIDNLVVLGIGGSALGNIALQSALNPPTWNLIPHRKRGGPRLFVLDNVDPLLIHHTFDFIRKEDPLLKRTMINVVSKSGETAETAAQFMIARELLKKYRGKSYAKHIIAVTDPEKGTMREICDSEGYVTLPVPEGVGGRFSVLSPVGLFSAGMCGINLSSLLDGAAQMDAMCSDPDIHKNPAAAIAAMLMEFTSRGKGNHVMMPYSNNLYLLADWFRQLWAESLGKRYNREGEEVFAGATPIKALGTTDQHSQVQLYREGPNDKVFCFLDVAQHAIDVTIPAPRSGKLKVNTLKYLQGAKLSRLLAAEKRATEFAFVESKRPNFTITFPRLNERFVGQFIQLWEIVTACCGLILGIDAYDQPAVETGKVATFGLMGREGYEEWKAKVESALAPTKHVIR